MSTSCAAPPLSFLFSYHCSTAAILLFSHPPHLSALPESGAGVALPAPSHGRVRLQFPVTLGVPRVVFLSLPSVDKACDVLCCRPTPSCCCLRCQAARLSSLQTKLKSSSCRCCSVFTPVLPLHWFYHTLLLSENRHP